MKSFRMTVVCLALLSVAANASIIYDYAGTVANGVNFDWRYDARLSADQKINDTIFPSFAVLFDFGPAGTIVGIPTYSAVVAGITPTTVLELSTSPQPVGTVSTDNPGLTNVRTNIGGSFNAAVETIL